jgi:phosphoribosylformylglycinamidine cyclo-ligase
VKPLDYRAAGVDIAAAEDAKARIRKHVQSTFNEQTRGAFGGFGGMFRAPTDLPDTVLVASADGVGSKLKVAIEADRHDTIGRDLVNHCVNDILVQGARPLFFLDYVAFAKLVPAVLEQIVAGVAAACRDHGCALIGGETAEMPDLYTPPDYDLAGFIVGAVDEAHILGGHRVQAGDVLLGVPSSGLHTNGYTLARRIVREKLRLAGTDPFPGTKVSVADILLTVHRSYFHEFWPLLQDVHALAHITGGGIPGNLGRSLPASLDAVVEMESWNAPDVFVVLAEAGKVDREEMFRTFNMGVGMVAVVAPERADKVRQRLESRGCAAWVMGEIQPGSGSVRLA